jgi:hypothetical protein
MLYYTKKPIFIYILVTKGANMIKNIIKGFILFLFMCCSFSPSVFAETKGEEYLGKRVSCLRTANIYSSYVLDDQTMLFETEHGVVYINRLPDRCHGLKVSDGYSYNPTAGEICKLDFIRVLESSYGATISCGLGDFIELKGIELL